jgi:glycosyltransferase involved in cell wall biosynthesis
MSPRVPLLRRTRSRRRIAVLSSCQEVWGGSEELWFEAACALRKQGHRVDVLKTGVDPGHPRIQQLLALGCRVRDLRDSGPRRVWGVANALLPLAQAFDGFRLAQIVVLRHFLRRRRPHLAIVSQGQNADGANLAGACRRLRVPYVLIVQKASELHWPEDRFRPYLQRVYVDARRVVFVSDHNRRLTEHQLGIAIPGARVLHNPVLVSRVGPLPWPREPEDVYRLACVARLFPAEKGQDLLLDVLAADRWRARPLHVTFFGQGVNREGLEGMSRLLGLSRASFAGQSRRIEEVWLGHHGLILPSRAEGTPLALLEAMACGRIAVVTAVGGNAEVVEDGVTGFVAAAPSVEAIDEALERAWQRRDEWEAIGRAAAARLAEVVPDESGTALTDLALAELSAGGR